MIDSILNRLAGFYDPLNRFWENEKTHRVVAGVLVVVFLAALAAIELNRQHLLPQGLAQITPQSHYLAINTAFTLVLILEVVSLLFTLPCSLSRALGKQFEILALIFMRGAFKEISYLPEPITIDGHTDVLLRILSDGGGAIAVFALLGLYSKLLRHTDDTPRAGSSLMRFITAKKTVALGMLIIFFCMGAYNGWLLLTGQKMFHFFQTFYTVLIFCDILLVLIAQSFLPQFRAIFRNSGYALSTLLIRLALTAPPFFNVLIGVASALFAVAVTIIYNTFYITHKKG
nr:hypothetical protein [Desulfobulbaceae bacterium]